MVVNNGFNDDQVGDNEMVFNREAVQFYDCVFFGGENVLNWAFCHALAIPCFTYSCILHKTKGFFVNFDSELWDLDLSWC